MGGAKVATLVSMFQPPFRQSAEESRSRVERCGTSWRLQPFREGRSACFQTCSVGRERAFRRRSRAACQACRSRWREWRIEVR